MALGHPKFFSGEWLWIFLNDQKKYTDCDCCSCSDDWRSGSKLRPLFSEAYVAATGDIRRKSIQS